MLTGKGEPTLYPNLIREYINYAREHFPFIELQTNGIMLKELNVKNSFVDREGNRVKMSHLEEWYKLGLTTICLSAVHYWNDLNQKIYSDKYPDLRETIKMLHSEGFSVRLSIMMLKGYVDTPDQVNEMVNFCKTYKVKQLTFRPIAHPDNDNSDITKWIKEHTLSEDELSTIKTFLKNNATPVLHLSHGATVYDYWGQNVCLTDCLTTNETDENMRQIIYYPDGTISYDWKYEGAVLL